MRGAGLTDEWIEAVCTQVGGAILGVGLICGAKGVLILRNRRFPGLLASDRRRDARAVIIPLATLPAVLVVALLVSAVRDVLG